MESGLTSQGGEMKTKVHDAALGAQRPLQTSADTSMFSFKEEDENSNN